MIFIKGLQLVLQEADYDVILASHQPLENLPRRRSDRPSLERGPSCSTPARWTKFVSVGPGIIAVTLTELSLSSVLTIRALDLVTTLLPREVGSARTRHRVTKAPRR
jgi:hypothetical protein